MCVEPRGQGPLGWTHLFVRGYETTSFSPSVMMHSGTLNSMVRAEHIEVFSTEQLKLCANCSQENAWVLQSAIRQNETIRCAQAL